MYRRNSNILHQEPQLIVTADDFGASSAVNRAVIRAHREGIVTTTSLMVAGDAVDEAVALARQNPDLAVGLHLVVVEDRATLSPSQIPHLVDDQGYLSAYPVRAGWRYFWSGPAQRELRREIEAQFERFAATGLRLSHVDGHMLMHMHPTVLGIVIPLAQRYGAAGLRVPRDNVRLGMQYDRHHMAARIGENAALGLLARYASPRLARHGLVCADRVYGLQQSGHMSPEYVLDVLAQLDGSSAEIYFHPSESPAVTGGSQGPNAGDLATLLDPRLQEAIAKRGIRLTTYVGLLEGM